MYIGKLLKERMEMLNVTPADVVSQSFLDFNLLKKIMNDEIELENIDDFSLALLSGVLHCKPEYFSDSAVREKDLVYVAKNKKGETIKSMQTRAKIQTFVNDMGFVEEVQKETS